MASAVLDPDSGPKDASFSNVKGSNSPVAWRTIMRVIDDASTHTNSLKLSLTIEIERPRDCQEGDFHPYNSQDVMSSLEQDRWFLGGLDDWAGRYSGRVLDVSLVMNLDMTT